MDKKILRYLSGKYSAKEAAAFEKLLDADPELQKEFQLFQKVWLAKRKNIHVDMDVAWQKIAAGMETQSSRQRAAGRRKFIWGSFFAPQAAGLRKGFAFAMMILVIAFSSYEVITRLSVQKQVQETIAYQTVKVDIGKRVTVTLNDGSIVTLDSGSELRYPEKFSDIRTVYLKGEAYFQVARNTEHPFHVYANQGLVKVLGTRFNVRAWDKSEGIEVAVQSGLVSFANKNAQQDSVLLPKNSYSILKASGVPSTPEKINAQNYVSWLNNEMYFKNASCREILAQLERWYGYHFYAEDESVLDKKLTVHLKRVNVDYVIELISVLTNTRIERENNDFKLLKK